MRSVSATALVQTVAYDATSAIIRRSVQHNVPSSLESEALQAYPLLYIVQDLIWSSSINLRCENDWGLRKIFEDDSPKYAYDKVEDGDEEEEILAA